MFLSIPVNLIFLPRGTDQKFTICISSCYDVFNVLLSSNTASLLKELEYSYHRESLQKSGGARRYLAASLSSAASLASGGGRLVTSTSSYSSLNKSGSPNRGLDPQEAELRVRAAGALANEVGLNVIELLENFSTSFKVCLQNIFNISKNM